MKGYELFSGFMGISMAISILWLIRRDHLHVKYSLWWLAVATGVAILGVFPGLLDVAGGLLGVTYPPTLGFLFAFFALFVKVLLADIERSRSRREILRLTQRLVLLEQRLEDIESQRKPGTDPSP